VRRSKSKFRCKLCGFFTKELHNCVLTYEDIGINILLCHRCLRRLGWRRLNKGERASESLGHLESPTGPHFGAH
jgi:hypothetical protein